jgi:hypothetical protein
MCTNMFAWLLKILCQTYYCVIIKQYFSLKYLFNIIQFITKVIKIQWLCASLVSVVKPFPPLFIDLPDTYMYFGGSVGITALSALAVSRSPRLMSIMMKNSWMVCCIH